jgi:cytochrome c
MQKTLTTLVFVALAAAPALAEGDAEAGKKVFNQCQTCHVVANEAGEILAGKAAKTGPNLYGIVGRVAGTQAEFKGYGDSLVALGATGFTWNEEDFVVYVQNPGKFLKDKLGDTKAKSKMSFQLKKEDDARNVWAFLASLSPAPAADAAATGAAPAEGTAAPSN